MSPRSTAPVYSCTGPRVPAACRTWRRHWPTEQRSTGSTQRTTRGRRLSWRCRGWASLQIIYWEVFSNLVWISVIGTDIYSDCDVKPVSGGMCDHQGSVNFQPNNCQKSSWSCVLSLESHIRCYINSFQGSLVTCEFLLQNAANVNQQDAQGRGPLHHATMLGHTGFVFYILFFTISSSLLHQTSTYNSKKMSNFSLFFRQVCLFLKRGANQNAADIDEKTPLSIAVDAANADIVTLWVLSSLLILFLFVYQYILWKSCLSFPTVKHN